MTYRELLELAAKAAGIKLEWCPEGRPWKKWPSFEWNPLTDDGDALRLAVQLRLTVDHFQNHVSVHGRGFITEVQSGDDLCGETRRAITLAAAEIGKAMPCPT